MTFKELAKVVSFHSKIVVKDRIQGTVLFSDFVPTKKELDSLEFKDRDIYLVISECSEDGSFICVVLY